VSLRTDKQNLPNSNSREKVGQKSIPGMGAEGIKENSGGKEFNYDICKCHNVPPAQT
jgi:hypothetical protein